MSHIKTSTGLEQLKDQLAAFYAQQIDDEMDALWESGQWNVSYFDHKKIKSMKIYTHDEVLDDVIGKKGTPRRERLEAEVLAGVEAYKMGEALKSERERQNLTQRELGEKAGVDESTVSKIERGYNATTASMFRIFCALGVTGVMTQAGHGC